MSEIIYWPETLRPQKIKVDIAHRSLRGSTAQSGFTQVVSNSAGIWTVTFDEIPIYSSQMIRLWRALGTLIEGQVGVISLPIWDFPRSPSAIGELGLNISQTTQTPHSDNTLFSDDSGYFTVWTDISVSTDANAGATTISLSKVTPVTLEPGHRFSINDRLYQIRTVSNQTNSAATVTIRPPLREQVRNGDHAEFDFPRVKVRLTDDKAMQIDLDYNANSFPTLSFFEAI